jgi:uncharacterized membrane protein YedE/YeeE
MTQAIVASLLGGALIGLAAAGLLVLSGREAGVSGIVAGLLSPKSGDLTWRALFVAGLLVGGAVAQRVSPALFASTLQRSSLALAVAGLLMGFGARLGSGCTSGHGVCGIGRLSLRSSTAVATFIGTGMLTVALVRYFTGAP